MKTQQSGFTLIELVMVIVILGILAAVAIPKFTDLKGEALQASTDAVAGAISSASASNVGVCAINSAHANCTALTNATPCATLTTAQPSVLPAGYAVTTETTCVGVLAGAAPVSCTITGTSGALTKTATAKIFCTG